MDEEVVRVGEASSSRTTLGKLVISAGHISPLGATLTVGRPGFNNLSLSRTGDAILFETPDDGTVEVRVVSLGLSRGVGVAGLLVTRISPAAGVIGVVVDEEGSNSPFTQEEIRRIAKGLDEVHEAMRNRVDVTAEQLKSIAQTLDEMKGASERLGRTDWKRYAIGTLTSIIVSLTLDRDVGQALLQSAGTALSWLFGAALRLLR